jgi:hypothetical protein
MLSHSKFNGKYFCLCLSLFKDVFSAAKVINRRMGGLLKDKLRKEVAVVDFKVLSPHLVAGLRKPDGKNFRARNRIWGLQNMKKH